MCTTVTCISVKALRKTQYNRMQNGGHSTIALNPWIVQKIFDIFGPIIVVGSQIFALNFLKYIFAINPITNSIFGGSR